jgi:hypothetical protein
VGGIAPTTTTPAGQVADNVPTAQVVVTYWTAELIGELVHVDGCLRVNVDGGTSYVLVWPPDLLATIEESTVRVKTGLVTGYINEVELHLGDTVRLSGGTTSALPAPLAEQAPPNCPEPYWVVGIEISSLGPAE